MVSPATTTYPDTSTLVGQLWSAIGEFVFGEPAEAEANEVSTAIRTKVSPRLTSHRSDDPHQASGCGPINTKTGDYCVKAGPITITDQWNDKTTYDWPFTNSCDHNIDIVLNGAQPTISPKGHVFSCITPTNKNCPWTYYECPAPYSQRVSAPKPSGMASAPSSAQPGAATSSASPTNPDEVEASLELTQAKTIDDFANIIKFRPGTKAASDARRHLQTMCNYRAVENSCSHDDKCIEQTSTTCKNLGYSSD
jgi:hypothetical protein